MQRAMKNLEDASKQRENYNSWRTNKGNYNFFK